VTEYHAVALVSIRRVTLDPVDGLSVRPVSCAMCAPFIAHLAARSSFASLPAQGGEGGADSAEVAQAFRDDLAHHSNMMPPGMPTLISLQ
jgi:hypothetical protein